MFKAIKRLSILTILLTMIGDPLKNLLRDVARGDFEDGRGNEISIADAEGLLEAIAQAESIRKHWPEVERSEVSS